MARDSIPRVRAQGDAVSIGFALGRATALGFREGVLRTEQYQALNAHWRGSDYLQGAGPSGSRFLSSVRP